jgi:hypothetical protein
MTPPDVQVIREEPLQEVPRGGALDVELAHVGEVEDAHVLAYAAVLGKDAAVLDGHFPTGEVHHAGAEREVRTVEGGAAGVT